MRSLIRTALCLFAAAFVFALTQEGCSAERRVKEVTAEATYLGQMLECVDRSATREQADECRREVRRRWHIAETTTADSGQHLRPDPWPFTDGGNDG